MKKLFNRIFQHPQFLKLFDLAESLNGRDPNQVRVLTYHRIDDAQGFRKQVEYLAKAYRVVSIPELLDASQKQKPLPSNALLITFDDAYQNFADCAWPILKEHGFPAALFVPTAYPNHPERVFWWDQLEQGFAKTARRDVLHTPLGALPLAKREQRVHAFKLLRKYVKTLPNEEVLPLVERIRANLGVARPASQVLSWAALRRLADEGVTLGAHTRTHPRLTQVSIAEAREEILGSLQDLQRETGVQDPTFAYPDGAYSAAVVEAVRYAGFGLAFSTRRGINNLMNFDPLLVRRNDIGKMANQPVLRARLLQAMLFPDRYSSVSTAASAAVSIS